MIWYVHRRDDGTIASAHAEPMEGYATEPLDETAAEMAAYFAPIKDPVPRTVTPLQLRRALRRMGLKTAVEAYVAQANEDVRDAWEYAFVIEIDDPLLVTAAQLLGVDLQSLFRLAGTFPRYQ